MQAYHFSIKALFEEAWNLTDGFKAAFWWGSFLFIILTIVFMFPVLALGQFGLVFPKAMLFLWGFLEHLCTLPLVAGLWMMGIHQATNKPWSTDMLGKYYSIKWKLLFVSLINFAEPCLSYFFPDQPTDLINYIVKNGFDKTAINSLMYETFKVGVSSSIFVLSMFSIPLLIEKKLSAWSALVTSFLTAGRHFFKIFGLFWLLTLMFSLHVVLIASLKPISLLLLIVYIWIAPFALMVFCLLYRDIFCVTSQENVRANTFSWTKRKAPESWW